MGKASSKKTPVRARDDLGRRGEVIFEFRITDFCGRDYPWFRCHFLGEKAATFDYLVELEDGGKVTPWFFFVQVRATKQGFTRRGPKRLKVRVDKAHVLHMARHPAPTYVVGIDEPREMAFIVAVFGKMDRGLPALPTAYKLDCKNLKTLWEEVKAFWSGRDLAMQTSAFAVEGY